MNLLFKMFGSEELILEEDTLVYLILLSDTKRRNRTVISRFSEDLLKKRIKDDCLVEESLESLLDEGWIEHDKAGNIIVAKRGRSKTIVLLSERENEYSAAEQLLSKIPQVSKKAPGQIKALTKEGWQTVNETLEKNSEDVGTYQLVCFFQGLYSILFQEKCRRFTQKEVGQMKTFLGFYNPTDCLDMLTEFFTNLDAYTKKTPNMGLVLYHKDNLYGTVKNFKSKAQKNSKYEKEDESF
jgi:hypothetical protein